MTFPIFSEINFQDPLRVFAFFAETHGAIFLDSANVNAANTNKLNRYSFIAIDPFQILSSKNGNVTLGGTSFTHDPFFILQTQLQRFQLDNGVELPPFQGGVVGYLGYELYQHLEKVKLASRDTLQFPDMLLGFYDLVIAFDLELKRSWVFSSGYPELEDAPRKLRAEKRRAWLLEKLSRVNPLAPLPISISEEVITHSFTSQSYRAAVSRVQEYILAGDIFEANITQTFQSRMPRDLTSFELYRRLRFINPAPFAAYLNFSDTVIASASPERFLQLCGNKVESRPIKGTRERGKTEDQDQQLATELMNSEKDRSENIMIVDLLRNDLSRVCDDHSVTVRQLCQIESYATVHHLVSAVEGKLQQGKNAVDLLRATFPGGSITGAPKVRVLEIIAEIEPTQRGPYCGSIGYIGFNGDMDCSIVIRSYTIKKDIITFQAGGAVVADSDPLAEYNEMLTKSFALRSALTNVKNFSQHEHDFIN